MLFLNCLSQLSASDVLLVTASHSCYFLQHVFHVFIFCVHRLKAWVTVQLKYAKVKLSLLLVYTLEAVFYLPAHVFRPETTSILNILKRLLYCVVNTADLPARLSLQWL